MPEKEVKYKVPREANKQYVELVEATVEAVKERWGSEIFIRDRSLVQTICELAAQSLRGETIKTIPKNEKPEIKHNSDAEIKLYQEVLLEALKGSKGLIKYDLEEHLKEQVSKYTYEIFNRAFYQLFNQGVIFIKAKNKSPLSNPRYFAK